MLCSKSTIRRTSRGIPEPAFQLVLDRDILLDHELGEDPLVKERSGSGTLDVGGGGIEALGADGIELAQMEHGGVELDGRVGISRGSEGSTSVSLRSRDGA